jgi:hypothetical protein
MGAAGRSCIRNQPRCSNYFQRFFPFLSVLHAAESESQTGAFLSGRPEIIGADGAGVRCGRGRGAGWGWGWLANAVGWRCHGCQSAGTKGAGGDSSLLLERLSVAIVPLYAIAPYKIKNIQSKEVNTRFEYKFPPAITRV